MKKKIFIFSLVLALIGIVAASNMTEANQSSIENVYYLSAGTAQIYPGDRTASTSVAFLSISDTASTTIGGFIGRADMVAVDLQLTASTTASILQYRAEYSRNGIDWYAEDRETVTTNVLIAHASTSPVHTWQPSITTVQRKHITFNPVVGKYFRLSFGMTGGNGSLYGIMTSKEQYP